VATQDAANLYGFDDAPREASGRSDDAPHPSRLDPDHPRRNEIIDAHHAAIVRGDPGYADPETGLTVLTAAFLRDRGECCGTGCRHCPYLP
jgi:Family of unknown function (DUF5522)